jgi:hypothetical protein
MEEHMHRYLGLSLALTLTTFAACNGGEDPVVECETSVTLSPGANETRAYYRTDVVATFNPQILAGATLTVTGPDGAVAGTTETQGRRLVFTPSSPLTPGAQYTTTVNYECNGGDFAPEASWTVSEVGAPTTLSSLVGKAYALDLANANFVQPEGIGALLGSFLTFDLLVGVKSVDEAQNKVTMIGALGVEGQPGVQEPCEQSIPFPEADISENPYFEVGPQKFSIEVSGQEVTIDNLFLAGAFAPNGSYIDGVVLSGTVDTRPFKSIASDGDPNAPDDVVCELALSLGVTCIPCPDGTGSFCISLLANQISAAGIPGPIEEIEDPCLKAECASDPDCET